MTEARTFEVVERTEKRTTYAFHAGGWQLPCGCIGPGFWQTVDRLQAHCDSCKRGWWTMEAGGSMCRMLDGGRQGPPLLVLMDKLVDA